MRKPQRKSQVLVTLSSAVPLSGSLPESEKCLLTLICVYYVPSFLKDCII